MSTSQTESPDPLLRPQPLRDWQRHRQFDVVIVGAGIAGLATALRLPAALRIGVVTKGGLGESNTRYAQGGFAAPIGPDDDVELHIADTLAAGAGLSDPDAVRTLIEGAAEAASWLIAQGTRFDQDDEGLALGKEAAHSRNRILHAGGDATGAEIERALVAQLRVRPMTTIFEHTAAIDLVVDDDPRRCRGVLVRGDAEEVILLAAQEVILANGGAGQLWSVTSNPSGATGDGMAMAIRAGVTLADLEFVQFHPTVLAIPDADGFLISEAVRGEGAYLRNAGGERFMLAIDPQAELAPRDVVARAIQRQMALDGTPFVSLDLRHLDAGLVHRRFPTISAQVRRYGLDLATDLIPVAPAAHYYMGGIVAGTDGTTSLPGLRAIGEVSCTGVHGANRLASNSLLEGLVFGLRAADAITQQAIEGDGEAVPEVDPDTWDGLSISMTDETLADLRRRFQQVMSADAAVVRSADSLAHAASEIQRLAADVATLLPDSVAAIEVRNMIALGRQVVASALFREESRGGHFRSDFPQRDPALDGMHTRVVRDGDTLSRSYGDLESAIATPIGACGRA
ncbi:MAG: L-aspartate oxidase [Thermomicrobiales bacterium]